MVFVVETIGLKGTLALDSLCPSRLGKIARMKKRYRIKTRHRSQPPIRLLSNRFQRVTAEKVYRISGHESFPCRYTWLPKAMRSLRENPKFFSNEEDAMVCLGVGKNMVRSIRFWSQVTGMAAATKKGGGFEPTDLARLILAEDGLDPYLEDIRTLWLMHWKLATNVENPLLAWDYLLNRWQEPDFNRSRVLKALRLEAGKQDDKLSEATLDQHFDTFIHTYVPTRGRKGEVQEDNLDCPLVELGLIVKVGEREPDKIDGRREPVFAFNP